MQTTFANVSSLGFDTFLSVKARAQYEKTARTGPPRERFGKCAAD